MIDLFEASSFELARQIRQQERTSLEIVRAHIEAIRRWNPLLNALVEERFAEALTEATARDEELLTLIKKQGPEATSKLPPLFGVPFTIKEMIAVEGFKTTQGSLHRRDNRSQLDATVVERLRKAGGILLGTTNVPELGFWFESNNPVYGKTSNPYDLTRTSGGSSGGEAALIGAGASPFGLGSDVGGSIRMPAGFCGVFGHKPTRRMLPLTGHHPVDRESAAQWTGNDYPLAVIGPLSRRATDLYPLMQILMGPDGYDSEIKNPVLKPRVTDWHGKTVWMLPAPGISGAWPVDPELRTATKTAARYFEVMGAELKVMRDDYFKEALSLWFTAMTRSTGRSFTDNLTGGNPISYGMEFLRIAVKRGRYTLPGLGASLLETIARKHEGRLASTKAASADKLNRMRKELNELLGENSILIMPTHARVAPPHGSTVLRPFDFITTAIFNALEMPATAVPMGLDEGLPLSVQVIAAEGQDHLTLSAAEVLESAFGGWQAPAFPSETT